MKLLLAVLIVVAPLVSSDRMDDLDWLPPNQQFSPLSWANGVTFPTCGVNNACPAGIQCSIYEPCTTSQGFCDTCIPPYYRVVTTDFKFTCIMPNITIGGACTKRFECYSLSSCGINTTKTCDCPAGQMASSDKTVCINDYNNMVVVGGVCNSSFQCGNSAQCGADRNIPGNTNMCSCYPGYKPAANNIDCVSLMPGDTCNPNSVNISNSQCTGTFSCLPNYKYINTLQTGDMFGDLIFGAQPGPACVPSNAILNLGLGASCSTSNICSPGLYCESCTSIPASTVCQGQSVLTITPVSTNPTTAPPRTCSATSVVYTSLVVIGGALLAALLH